MEKKGKRRQGKKRGDEKTPEGKKESGKKSKVGKGETKQMKTNSNDGGRKEVIAGMLSIFLSEIPSVLLLRPPAADVVSEWKAPVRRCPSP